MCIVPLCVCVYSCDMCSVHTVGVYVCQHIYMTYHDFTGKKQQPATLKLGGVSVNFLSILKREEELAPLALCIPKDPATRKRSAYNTITLYVIIVLYC